MRRYSLALQSAFLLIGLVVASPPLPLPEDPQENLSPNCRIPKCPIAKSPEDQAKVFNLAYPLDCLQYVECKGSEARVLACPPDQVFDKNTFVCGDRDKVRCVPCYQQAS